MTIRTKIHGKMYDLTNFNHPGGQIPIYLIDNKDGTCLFESYHPVSNKDNLNKILQKYEIDDDNSIPEQQVYDFTNFCKDPFVTEVREKVYNYFKELSVQNNSTMIEATKSTPLKYFELFILGLLFIINLRYMYIGYYFSIITTPFFYWLFTVNIFHDAGHFAHINNKFIEMLIFACNFNIFSSIGWYNLHTENHHSYSNIIRLDNDIQPFFYKEKKKNQINIFFKILIKLFYSNSTCEIELINLGYVENIILIILDIMIKFLYFKYFFINKLTNGIIYALTFYIIPQLLLILIFFIFTQVNHIHDSNFVTHSNFYYHQIITATNIKTDSYIMRILTGGLNCQIEHHLFPSVNSCHLPALAKIIKPLCIKYNINYNESPSLNQAVSDTIKTIKKLNPNL